MVIHDNKVYNSNHERSRMVIQLLATWIPALLIALSGVLKLSGNPKIVEAMAAR